MPTYTYACRKCESEFDVYHGISESPKLRCEACGSKSLQRLIGSGAGIIFKGSGFYETDYKRKAEPKPAGDAAKSESKSDTPAETKAAPKAESKPSESSKKSESKAASTN